MKWIKNNIILMIVSLLLLTSLLWEFIFADLLQPTIETTPIDPIEIESTPDFFNQQSEPKLNTTYEKLYVDLKGKIHKPGVYLVDPDDRVIDVIESAGGFTNDADENQINLAEKVYDAMVIFVPSQSEENNLSVQTNTNHGKIRINQATQTELEELPGIGASKAQAIIQYREENGPFKEAEELQNISGIGLKTFEKLEAFVIVP